MKKSRSAKWRDAHIAKGGKAIGVTLNPGAGKSLEILQETFGWSQRQAISFALEFTERHKDQIDVSNKFQQIFLETFKPQELKDKVELMERRLQEVETEVAHLRESAASMEKSIETSFSPNGEKLETSALEAGRKTPERWKSLLLFTAGEMLKQGERVSRSKLYELAKAQNIPIQTSLHEFSTFLSLNMDGIRDIMRILKKGEDA